MLVIGCCIINSNFLSNQHNKAIAQHSTTTFHIIKIKEGSERRKSHYWNLIYQTLKIGHIEKAYDRAIYFLFISIVKESIRKKFFLLPLIFLKMYDSAWLKSEYQNHWLEWMLIDMHSCVKYFRHTRPFLNTFWYKKYQHNHFDIFIAWALRNNRKAIHVPISESARYHFAKEIPFNVCLSFAKINTHFLFLTQFRRMPKDTRKSIVIKSLLSYLLSF